MFMLRMFHVKNGCRLVTRTFHSLQDAEDYADYHYNLGWTIFELVTCDYTLSDMFCADAT